MAVTLAAYVGSSWAAGHGPSIAYITAALMIAGISWADDVFTVPSGIRLAVHLAGAILIAAENLPISGTKGFTVSTALLGLLAVAWLVWFTNAYNFMDGIDGIAGLQAVVAALGWVFVVLAGSDGRIAPFPAAIAGSAFGFLLFNWSPAKVFMGDVGSAFLGFTLASMPFLVERNVFRNRSDLAATSVILVWFFAFDSLVTLLRRLAKGEKIWLAHRQHIYQRLIIGGVTHSKVAILYGAFSIILTIEVVLVWLGILGNWLIVGASIAVLSAGLVFVQVRCGRLA